MAIDLSPAPFTWGAGGARMTPEAIASQRKVAQAMMQQGMDYSPIQSPWQGAARVAQAMLGGLESGQADAAAKANQEAEAKLLDDYFSGRLSAAPTPTVAPATPAAAAAPMGANAIPPGQPDASLSDAISKVAAARGVDPAYMTRLAMVESGGKLDARSPLSSASGPFQFLNSTARQYGLNNPMDPAASADAAARFTLDNKAALANRLGREPTPGELYLAHQQGAGAAANLLANPDAPVESIIGPAAARNNGATPGMTAGQFASKWTGKFGDIVQTVDPAQKNILDAAADSPTMMTQADPAALPVNAQAAQGFAVPGHAATPQAAPGVNPALVRAMSSPYVSDGTKKILGLVLNQQMEAAQKAADPLRRAQLIEAQGKIETMPLDRRAKELSNMKLERELQGEGAQPLTSQERMQFGIPEGQAAYKTRNGEIKFGPAGMKVTTNVGAEAPDGALRKKLDEGTAKNWSAWQEAGHVSAGQVQDLQMLDELIKVAPQGPLTGRLAEMFPGFSSGGDAFNAIVKRVAPTMRAPGSGSTSDIEYDGMLRSLPALRNKPEANTAISEMMKAKAAINIERADIISQYSQNQISRNDAEKRLGELNRRSIMTPAMRQMLAGLGGKDSDVLPGDVVDGYRFKGGNKADKSAWEKVQ